MGWKRCLTLPLLLALAAYHFFLATYLFLVKRIRNSWLFPGS
jgi:hypothetical protein